MASKIILKAVWLLLPACFAKISPFFFKRLFPRWNTPIDLDAYWKGIEIFGSHKIYRGFISGTIIGLFIFGIQQGLFRSYLIVQNLSLFNYDEVSQITYKKFGVK